MQIGIVSDIHGDIESLRTALRIFDSKGIDKIVCAGDLVDGEIHGDAVVDLLKNHDIPCVQGNHDRDAFAEQSLLRRQLRKFGETEHDYLLKSETIAYLSLLPLIYEFDVGDHKICIAHGTPESNTSYLFPESSPDKFHAATKQTDANILILGHTHVPMFIQCDNKYIVNVGSVYRNRNEGLKTCGVLDTETLAVDLVNIQTREISNLIIKKQ